jgi:uncharacterized repeat protein (TIGR01451 family)
MTVGGFHPDGRAGRPLLASILAGALAVALALLIATAASAAPPVANDDTLTTAEDVDGTVDVLANDSDPDGDTLTIVDWTSGANALVECATDCTYKPFFGFSGSDSFTYTVDDGNGERDTATVSVTVTAVNDPPTAGPDSIVLSGGSGSANVLANDTDEEGDALSVSGWTNGSSGTVTCVSAGTCTYTAGASFGGTDSFTYDVSDGNGGTATGVVDVCGSQSAAASSLASAIASDPGTIVGASYVATPACGKPNAVSSAALAGFPTATSSYAILTSGDADLADDPNTAENSGADLGGPNVRGTTDLDVTILKIDLDVPAGRNCLTFDFRFLSEEFEEFVGNVFNDAFIAELDTSNWTTVGSSISAPNNFAFDPSGDVISINSSGATSMTSAHAAGTTYDGATPLLAASTPITPGAHSLYLSIFDQQDRVWDSAVFVDGLVLGTTAPGGCEAGATVLTTAKTADSPSAPTGGANGYTITIGNPSNAAVTLDSIFDVLPAGFTYVAGSTTGATTANPTINGQTLTWTGPFSVPASGSVTLSFDVTVSLVPGDYFNDAGGDATTGAVTPTGPTAKITVTLASADLSITKADSVDPVTVGQNLTYTLSVANAGPDPALDVVVNDTLPASVAHVSTTPSQGTCLGTTTISCVLGTIALNGSATVTIVVTPLTDADLSNTATVASHTADPTPANDTDTETTVVNPLAASADLSITKADSVDPVTVGQELTYILVVANAGPSTAQAVTVTDTLPVTVNHVSTTTTVGSCSGTTTVTCDLGALAMGGAGATIAIKVVPTTDADLTNTAGVTSTTDDPSLLDNTDTETTVVNATPVGPVCNGLPATIVGGPRKDDIQGTAGADVIVDLGGDNYIQTGGGNDHICLAGGDDEVDSGDGNDFVDAGNGKNKIKTGNGSDTVRSGTGADGIDTGDGNDTVVDLGGKNKIFTGNDDDSVASGMGDDEIETGNGDDVVVDAGGNNRVVTGNDDDRITTGAGNDEIDGGNGFDTCSPGVGSNKVKDCEG